MEYWDNPAAGNRQDRQAHCQNLYQIQDKTNLYAAHNSTPAA
jgi:hypothetical protein